MVIEYEIYETSLTLSTLMDSSFWFDTKKTRDSPLYISRVVRLFFCQKIFFTFTNSVDPDEMQHYAAFHLGLYCLQKYSFTSFPNTKV